jgi:hypothetical protein
MYIPGNSRVEMMNTRRSIRRTKDIQDPIRFDRSAILMKQHSANGTKKCIEVVALPGPSDWAVKPGPKDTGRVPRSSGTARNRGSYQKGMLGRSVRDEWSEAEFDARL